MVWRAFLSLSNYAKEFSHTPPFCKANILHLIFETPLVSHSQLVWLLYVIFQLSSGIQWHTDLNTYLVSS